MALGDWLLVKNEQGRDVGEWEALVGVGLQSAGSRPHHLGYCNNYGNFACSCLLFRGPGTLAEPASSVQTPLNRRPCARDWKTSLHR